MKTKYNLKFQEKVKLLTERDKIYLHGYIDRALNIYIDKSLKNEKAEKTANEPTV